MSLIFTEDASGRAYGVRLNGHVVGSIVNYGNIIHGDIWTVCCDGIERATGSIEYCQQVIRDWARKQMKEQAQIVTVVGFGRVARQCPSNIRFAVHNGNEATQSVKVSSDGVETWVNHVSREFTKALRKGQQVQMYMDLGRWYLRPLRSGVAVAA